MTKIVPLTKNRQVIYDFLSRAQRFHCTVSTIHEFDITKLLQVRHKIAETGSAVSLNTCLIKATSLVIEKYPRLNHHLFHGLFRKHEVEFDDICCNMIILRKYQGELILLPVLIERTNELSLLEIEKVIAYHTDTPIEEISQFSGLQRMKSLPRIGMRLFSFRCRSDYRFYRRYFGTYGYSSMIVEDEMNWLEARIGMAGRSEANTCAAFQPTSVSDEPIVVDGQVTVGKILTMTFLADHYLIDGHNGMMAMRHLRRLLAEPELLGLAR